MQCRIFFLKWNAGFVPSIEHILPQTYESYGNAQTNGEVLTWFPNETLPEDVRSDFVDTLMSDHIQVVSQFDVPYYVPPNPPDQPFANYLIMSQENTKTVTYEFDINEVVELDQGNPNVVYGFFIVPGIVNEFDLMTCHIRQYFSNVY